MKFNIHKPSRLNEALLGNRNMGYPTNEIEVKGAVPVDFAAAINEYQTREKKTAETFKEFKDKAEEFVKQNHNRKVKGKATSEMKKMHLSEAVDFGDPMEFGRGPCVPIVHNYTRTIMDAVKGLKNPKTADLAMNTLRRYVYQLSDTKLSLEDFNTYWQTRYPASVDYVDRQISLIPDDVLNQLLGIKNESIIDLNLPVTANITANGNTVPFLNGSAKTEDIDPDFFAIDNEQTLTESPTAVMDPPVKKKRKRGPNEKPDIADYSSMDLWYAVYDELSATTDHEGEGKTVNKQLKARRGERYEHVYPHGDTDIVVYAMDIEDLDFAKRVADHYGVIAEKPKKDNNPRTNGYYKYSMIIRIPPEELYTY